MRLLATFAGLAAVLFAPFDIDTVHMKGGTSMTGKLTLDGLKGRLEIPGGGSVELDLEAVVRIQWGKDSGEPAKLRKLYAARVDGAIDRARWCSKFGLEKEAKEAWAEVLRGDPESEEALKALGKKKPAAPKDPKKEAPARKAGPVVKSGPDEWKEIVGGLTLRTEHFELRGDIGKEKLVELAAVAEKMNVFHRVHFGGDIGTEWKITIIQKQADFVAYSKKIGSTHYGAGGDYAA